MANMRTCFKRLSSSWQVPAQYSFSSLGYVDATGRIRNENVAVAILAKTLIAKPRITTDAAIMTNMAIILSMTAPAMPLKMHNAFTTTQNDFDLNIVDAPFGTNH